MPKITTQVQKYNYYFMDDWSGVNVLLAVYLTLSLPPKRVLGSMMGL